MIRELVFDGNDDDLRAWQQSPVDAARLVWEAKTERRKLSTLAEEFFRRLAGKRVGPMLLTKGELHRLVPEVPLAAIAPEVTQKLDLLSELFGAARNKEEVSTSTNSTDDD